MFLCDMFVYIKNLPVVENCGINSWNLEDCVNILFLSFVRCHTAYCCGL